MASNLKYDDIIVEIKDGVGMIKFNRPKQLNSFGGSLVEDTVDALRKLDEHPDTTFTVITGEGRFFSAGADVSNVAGPKPNFKHDGAKKIYYAQQFATSFELLRSMIEHRKVLVLALNGPGVGGGAAWFQGVSDLFFAAEGSWLQVVFSELGLVPENGSAINWADSLGVHKANEWLMLGEKVGAEEMEKRGLVNRVFPVQGFHESVRGYLAGVLETRNGKSMMEMKRLQNRSLREQRLLAVIESTDALAERFVDGEPLRRMTAKMDELAAKRKGKESKL